jgi:hypothetical protein
MNKKPMQFFNLVQVADMIKSQANPLTQSSFDVKKSASTLNQVMATLFTTLLPQEQVLASAITCRTVRCGPCGLFSRLRVCHRRCCRPGFGCWNRVVRVRC